MPPPSTSQGRMVALMSIAPSMPCTGNGVNVSQSRKPALRTFSDALISASGVSYSARRPWRGASPGGALGIDSSLIVLTSVAPGGVGVLRLDLGHRNHRQVPAEQEEEGEEQPEAAGERQKVPLGRRVVAPGR